jgi:hypothetical protein
VIFLLITANAVESEIAHEREADGRASFDEDVLRHAFATLEADRYPHLVTHAPELTSGDHRARFVFGIDTFVAGLLR